MWKGIRKVEPVEQAPLPRLGDMIHQAVRVAIERAVEEELEVALSGASLPPATRGAAGTATDRVLAR